LLLATAPLLLGCLACATPGEAQVKQPKPRRTVHADPEPAAPRG
jgi:hypothetical protein